MPVGSSQLAAGTAFVDVVPNMDKFGKQLTTGVTSSFGKVQATGQKLTRSLTPIAAGVGAAFLTSFKQVDTGLDAIRAGTGATGDELKALGDVMKGVAGRVVNPISEVGTVLADLQTRTGLTGDALGELTQRTLELANIQGTSGLVLSEKLTRAFGDWSIATEDQAGAMDKLFRASQATGPPVDKLADLIVRFGAPLRQFGFGIEESAALMGKFEKEGVNTELVIGSLRQGLGKLAREGVKDIPGAFRSIVEEIANAGNAGKANARAMEIFGARAGPDMAAAIREGRFDLGELFDLVKDGTETIEQANADTLDFGDRFKMLKNRVQAVIGPFGEVGFALSGVAAGIGPALVGFGKLGQSLSGAGGLAGMLSKAGSGLVAFATNPITLVIAAIAGLAFLIFKFRDEIGAALKAIGRFFVRVFNGVVGFLKRWGPLFLAVVLGPVGLLVGLVIKNFTTIKNFVVGVFNAIKGAIKVAIDVVVGLFQRWVAIGRRVRDVLVGAFKVVKNVVGGAIQFVIDLVNKLLGPLKKVLDIGGKVLGFAGNLAGKVGGFLGGLNPFQHGGPFKAGETMLVGEKRPEVVQFDRPGRVFPSVEAFARASGGGGGGDRFEVTINNPRPERASESIPRALRVAQLQRGR